LKKLSRVSVLENAKLVAANVEAGCTEAIAPLGRSQSSWLVASRLLACLFSISLVSKY
jgi:hypothetical protein